MATTIQVSSQLLQVLKDRKVYDKESYEEVIWDLVEDGLELTDETKKHIEIAQKQIQQGRSYTHEEIKRKLGI